MKIETPAGGYVEITRDDAQVFETSPSAIVLTLASDYGKDFEIDCGPTLVQFDGKIHTETLLAFPLDAARRLHDELGRLLGPPGLRDAEDAVVSAAWTFVGAKSPGTMAGLQAALRRLAEVRDGIVGVPDAGEDDGWAP